MSLWTAAGACLLVALVSTLVTVSRNGRPGSKRTHLFEDDGERANPFADISAGAADAAQSARSCAGCGTAIDDSYRFCVACGSSVDS